MSEYKSNSSSEEEEYSDHFSGFGSPDAEIVKKSSQENASIRELLCYRDGKGPIEGNESPTIQDDISDSEPKSKRQRRLANIQDPGFNGKSRGHVVLESDASMIWWHEDGDAGDGTKGTWEEAVYHNEIRGELLALASRDGQHSYNHPRMRGWDANDETAFFERQKDWNGEERQCWSTIANGIRNRFEPRDYKGPQQTVGWIYFGDMVVLDQDKHPVRDFKDMPATLSSAVEPWLLEAISRIDGRISKVDFQARMPWTSTSKNGICKQLITPAALGNKTMRFRELHGLIAWTPKAGSDPWKKFILSRMSPEQVANNSTEGLGEFSHEEIRAAKTGNGASSSKKAENSKLSNTSRSERRRKQARIDKISKKRKTHKTKRSSTRVATTHLQLPRIDTSRQIAGSSRPAETYTSQQQAMVSTSDLADVSPVLQNMGDLHMQGQPGADKMHFLPIWTSSQAEPIDYRSVPPQNQREEANIQAALRMTHQAIIQHFGETAPTKRGQSYSRQWDELQSIYMNSSDPPTRAIRGMPEYLPRLARWYGGFAAWEDVDVLNGPAN